MIGAVPLLVASGGGQCLAVNGCHAYGPRIVGIIVDGAVLVTFIVIAVRLWRKPATQSLDVDVDSFARPGSAARMEQIIEGAAVRTDDRGRVLERGSSRVSGEAVVLQRAKLPELHQIDALSDEEFARQMARLKPEP